MNNNLTELQSFNATMEFLDLYYSKTSLDYLAVILGGMLFLPDNNTADPAVWGEWSDAVNKVLQKSKERNLTELQAFNAMIKFLDYYYQVTSSLDLKILFEKLKPLAEGGTSDALVWEEWTDCVNKVLKEKPGTRRYLIPPN